MNEMNETSDGYVGEEEPILAEPQEPFLIWLRSERVQEPQTLTPEGEAKPARLYEIALSRACPVTIGLPALELSLTIHVPQMREVA